MRSCIPVLFSGKILLSFLGDFFKLSFLKKGEKVNLYLLTSPVNQDKRRWKQMYMVQQSDAQQNREPQDSQKTTS